MDLNAEISGTESNSYLTLDEADTLMDGFMSAEKWDALKSESNESTGNTVRERMLRMSARLVDLYRPLPPRQVPTQALAFPTVKDPTGVVPASIKLACAYWIDAYLENGADFQVLKKLQAEGVTSMSQLGQSSSFGPDNSMLPALARKSIDKVVDTYDSIVVDGPGTCERIW